MDHLPFGHLKNLPWPTRLDVPYYPPGAFRYDGLDIVEFYKNLLSKTAIVEGFNQVVETEAALDDDQLCSSLLSFLQQWLFFGFFREVCEISGLPFETEDFVFHRIDGTATVITTELPRYVAHWFVLNDSNDQHYCQSLRNKLEQKLHYVHHALRYIGEKQWCQALDRRAFRIVDIRREWSDCFSSIFPRASVILLSVCLLAQTVRDVADKALRVFEWNGKYYNDPFLHDHLFKPRCPTCVHEFLDFWLQKAGWCPQNIVDVQRYMQNGMDDPFVKLIHLQRPRSQPKKHERCTLARCYARQDNKNIYEQAHKDGCIGCSNLELNSDQAFEAVGVNFGVKFVNNELFYERLRRNGYVAISHVWSDGMGNPNSNSLPLCTVNYVQQLVNIACNTDENMPFWIDTLCVPVDNDTQRKAAIRNMFEIYKSARVVLVVDGELASTPYPSNQDEALIAISGCHWNSRLWTLQESRISTDLKVVFQDFLYSLPTRDEYRMRAPPQILMPPPASAFEISDRFNSTRNACARSLQRIAPDGLTADVLDAKSNTDGSDGLAAYRMQNFMWHDVYRSPVSAMLRELRTTHHFDTGEKEEQEVRWYSFQKFVGGLRHRKTSRKEDETTCLAISLRLSTDEVLEAAVEDRMKNALLQIHTFSKQLAFFTGPRYQNEGFRWAPRSFLSEPNKPPSAFDASNRGPYPPSNRFESVDDSELCTVSSEGLKGTFAGLFVHTSHLVLESQKQVSHLIVRLSKGRKIAVCFDKGVREENTVGSEWITNGRNMAVVLPNGADPDDTQLFCSAIALSTTCKGAQDDELRGRFESNCAIIDAQTHPGYGSPDTSFGWGIWWKESLDDPSNNHSAEWIPDGQHWLIQ